MLDYGAHLKRVMPNPSRRSAHHVRQSPFEGSRRQKRAHLLRAVIEQPGASTDQLADELAVEHGLALELLAELAAEGFLRQELDSWTVA